MDIKDKNLKRRAYFKDEYAMEEERWWWIFQNPLGMLLIGGTLILILIGGWYIFKPSSSIPKTAPPIIEGDTTAYKEPPKENLQVAHQDKQVFQRISPPKSPIKERVLPKEEQPIDVDSLPEEEPQNKSHGPKNIIKVENKIFIKLPEPRINKNYIQQKKVETKIKPSPKKTIGGLSPGSYVIRIASFRKEKTAQKEAQRVFDAFPSPLKGVGHVIKKQDTSKGIYYSVIIGGFPNFNKAKEMAAKLSQKNFEAVIQKIRV